MIPGWEGQIVTLAALGFAVYLFVLYRQAVMRLHEIEQSTPRPDIQQSIKTLRRDLTNNKQALEELSKYLLQADEHLDLHRGRLDQLERRAARHHDAIERLSGYLEGELGRIDALIDIVRRQPQMTRPSEAAKPSDQPLSLPR